MFHLGARCGRGRPHAEVTQLLFLIWILLVLLVLISLITIMDSIIISIIMMIIIIIISSSSSTSTSSSSEHDNNYYCYDQYCLWGYPTEPRSATASRSRWAKARPQRKGRCSLRGVGTLR